ncbi:sensor histidine kinase, partial [Planomonospora corallina]
GRCRAAVQPAFTAAGVELAAALAPDLPPLQGDAAQLERVLLNLLSNAVKFTPRGGTVTVSAGRDGGVRGDTVTLAVADTGVGIPEEEQGRLFTRFFRSSTASDNQVPGTGLGLAISKAIVDAHGGTIGVRSVPGRGTTVTVTLPLAAPAPQSAASVVPQVAGQPGAPEPPIPSTPSPTTRPTTARRTP